MKIFRTLERTLLIRLGVSLLLAAAALGLFWVSRSGFSSTPHPEKHELTQSLANDLDHEVDSVLARFKIEKAWVRKSSTPLSNGSFARIVRRVAIPRDVVTVQMNVAFNSMAKKYNGRAVASENLKDNSVTIHIEMQGYIVQTIILKTNPALKRAARKDGQTKV